MPYNGGVRGQAQTLLTGDLDSIKDDRICELQSEIGEFERMLKALITSWENKPANPIC